MEKRNIPLFVPSFDVDGCLAEIRVCLEKGWTGIGFKTTEFEDLFSEYVGEKYCHFVNSNTNGIHLLLEMLKLTKGWADDDEIISTGLTFVSTNHSIIHAGLKPVFADVDRSLCITAAEVERKITPRTRAVVFVAIGGNSAELPAIADLCRAKGLAMILDAAHSAGARLHGRHLSSYADYSIFSFQAVKNLPTGDSGLITVRTEEEDRLVRQLSWCGINKDTYSRSQGGYRWQYSVDAVGFKYHGNSIMAAIAIAQLRLLEAGNARRRELAALYRDGLAGLPDVHYIAHSNEEESSRHLIQFILPRRNDLIAHLQDCGVGTGVHYLCNSRYGMYSHNDVPFSQSIDERIISLPCHLKMTDEDAGFVIDRISEFYGKK